MNAMIVLIVIVMVHNMTWWYHCCTSLYPPITYVVLSTQNKVLEKVMLKFIALQLMSYFNSINSSETPITLIYFIKCAKITQIFICMNAKHTSVASILRPLILRYYTLQYLYSFAKFIDGINDINILHWRGSYSLLN
jgi:hypothetical protein